MPSSRAERGAGLAAAVRDGLAALALRRPRADRQFTPATVFAMLLPLLALDLALGWFAVAGRYGGWEWDAVHTLQRDPSAEGLIATLAGFAALLVAAWLAVLVLDRRGAFWSLAAPLAAAWIGFGLLSGTASLAIAFTVEDPWAWYLRLRLLYAALWLLVVWRLLAGFARASVRWRRALAALAVALVTAGGMWLHAWPDYWEPDWEQLRAERAEPPPRVPAIDGEAVMYAQPRLLDAALSQLAPQRPDRTDLYALGFAGDGHESVFANEVRHFDELVSTRYDAAGRTVALVNDPDTATTQPIASLTALETALAAIAARMDREQDLLLLFLTTHGSEDHRLLVQLGGLPLQPIRPEALAAALDASGIRWRIVIVSACFSGGFIEPLADPHTIVITAARADRSSFGCGVASDITWFGQAFLAEALNETRDPIAAFELATARIAEREQVESVEPSEPQIHIGTAIAGHLAAWLDQLPPAPPVPFRPPAAPPAGAGDATDPNPEVEAITR